MFRQCPARFVKLSASKFSPRSNRPVGIAARPPKSSASLHQHSTAVSATTISNEEDSHKKAHKHTKTIFLFLCALCAFLWLIFEQFPIDLAAIVFGKGIDELDPARVFVDCDISLHELLDI